MPSKIAVRDPIFEFHSRLLFFSKNELKSEYVQENLPSQKLQHEKDVSFDLKATYIFPGQFLTPGYVRSIHSLFNLCIEIIHHN